MASAAGSGNRVLRIAGPALLPAIAYGLYKSNTLGMLESFFTGPGRTSRIVALVVLVVNWKSLPLAWTFRVWHAMISHFGFRRLHKHTPDKLFHPIVTPSHVSLLEVDYNIHKSNSTYFADLDVSRSHLVCHLFARGCEALSKNASTHLVMDPSNPSKPAKGRFGVMLGAVHCSFKKELQPYQKYDMWSRVLSWDRKWLYIITHFVERGAIKPDSWDASSFNEGKPQGWEKKIHATAISKYVFKIGRLTVHPAVLIEASGMLPERPGGWVAVEDGMAPPSHTITGGPIPEAKSEAESSDWDWKQMEEMRQKGHEFAAHFAALDGLHSQFDAGKSGPLAKFGIA
ncbi:capsule polysaccharide biosynthesis protein [Hypoxylon trugodes]|uniref:capsule polysaccharide biosynthesis protein n=1 Tax=Hypoxylon trugodes TaxID=326681 RepID=UPI00218F3F8B|nr:capsule polysaccharide biosynthesis protein [Hypoxylon trugodes]KAI1394376.1 capsule polysaccharide biosynthesis protein [Hypoxylon trugodes]